ncbi:MAG: hypothetical protein ACFCU6_02780 [Balneolaceae bacterium]
MKKLKTHIIEMNPYALILAIILTLVYSGCSDFTQIPAAADLSVMEITEPGIPNFVQLPLSGSCETTFDPPTFLRPPAVFSQIDVGTCHLSHLGKSTFYSLKEIDFAAGTQKTTEATFTAANGDILRATGEGVSSPGEPGKINFTATLQFDGGTGRFTNATGYVKIEGQADIILRQASLVVTDGKIDYKASDRRR